MPRHRHQKQIRKPRPQPPALLRQQRLLPRVRAPAHDHQRVLRHAHLREQRPRIQAPPPVPHRRVEFQIPHHAHPLRSKPQLAQSSRVHFILRAHAAESREQIPKQKSAPPIPAKRPLRQPRVHQKQRHFSIRQFPQKIRPNLRLHQNHRLRPHQIQRAPHAPAAIDRVIHFQNVLRQFFAQLPHPRRSRRRNQQRHPRQTRLQRANQLHAHIHLAHAHRVQPHHAPPRHRRAKRVVVARKPLPKSRLPIPPPPHLPKIKRRADAE